MEASDQDLGALLVASDLTKSDGSGSVSVVAGADLRAALVASCLRGAFPPVDLRCWGTA